MIHFTSDEAKFYATFVASSSSSFRLENRESHTIVGAERFL